MDYGVYSRHSACLRTISARCQIQSTPRFCTFALQSYKISERNAKENLFSFHFRTKSKFSEAKDIK